MFLGGFDLPLQDAQRGFQIVYPRRCLGLKWIRLSAKKQRH